jgi:hypothetical protein
MKLNVCLTIIPLRAAQGGNADLKARAQNDARREHDHRHSAFEGGAAFRSSHGGRAGARRIATRGLWLKKASACA